MAVRLVDIAWDYYWRGLLGNVLLVDDMSKQLADRIRTHISKYYDSVTGNPDFELDPMLDEVSALEAELEKVNTWAIRVDVINKMIGRERDELKAQLHDLEVSCLDSLTENAGLEKTIAELRAHVVELEKG